MMQGYDGMWWGFGFGPGLFGILLLILLVLAIAALIKYLRSRSNPARDQGGKREIAPGLGHGHESEKNRQRLAHDPGGEGERIADHRQPA